MCFNSLKEQKTENIRLQLLATFSRVQYKLVSVVMNMPVVGGLWTLKPKFIWIT